MELEDCIQHQQKKNKSHYTYAFSRKSHKMNTHTLSTLVPTLRYRVDVVDVSNCVSCPIKDFGSVRLKSHASYVWLGGKIRTHILAYLFYSLSIMKRIDVCVSFKYSYYRRSVIKFLTYPIYMRIAFTPNRVGVTAWNSLTLYCKQCAENVIRNGCLCWLGWLWIEHSTDITPLCKP